jgi:hypothetical protein
MAKTVKNADETTATTTAKKSLSEAQREGAISRAIEAANRALKVQEKTADTHPYAEVIGKAVESANDFATAAETSGSTADAQYASRKADEAAVAAAWLLSQKA